MLFFRQVQRRVRRVQVRRLRRPIGHPGHSDLPEHSRQLPLVPGLGAGPRDTVRASHLRAPLLAGRPQVQVILVQPPQQLPAPRIQLLLQLGVRQPGRLPARQPLLNLGETCPGLGERGPARTDTTISARRPGTLVMPAAVGAAGILA